MSEPRTCDCPIAFPENPALATQVHRISCPLAPKSLTIDGLARLMLERANLQTEFHSLEGEGDEMSALVVLRFAGDEQEYEYRYSMADAKRDGHNSTLWQRLPKLMLLKAARRLAYEDTVKRVGGLDDDAR